MLAHELRNPLAPLLTGLHVLRQRRAEVRASAGPGGDGSAGAALEPARGRPARRVASAHGRFSSGGSGSDLARLVRTTAEDHRALLAQAGLALAVRDARDALWVHGRRRAADAGPQQPARQRRQVHRPRRPGRRAAGARTARRPASICGAPTRASASRRRCCRACSTPFAQADRSLDRRGAAGWGWAWPWSRVWSSCTAARWRRPAGGRAAGRSSRYGCRPESEPAALSRIGGRPWREWADAPLRKVVVIEDNRDAADSLRHVAGGARARGTRAYTGPEGVPAAAAWRPDVVMSDIGLPGFDGYEVARRIRRHAGPRRRLAGGPDRLRQARTTGKASEVGFDHHLVKPADPDDLQPVLAERAAGVSRPVLRPSPGCHLYTGRLSPSS